MALKYDCYLFDFDGTIADTGEGIRRSVAYSLEKLGRPVPERRVLDRFIGPPLHDSYMEYCGLTEDEAVHAVEVYRERYVDVGLYESALYPGIAALLRALHRGGAYVAIASAKPQFMLERLSRYYEIDPGRWALLPSARTSATPCRASWPPPERTAYTTRWRRCPKCCWTARTPGDCSSPSRAATAAASPRRSRS